MSEKEEMLKRKREEEARARRILEEDLANDGKPRIPRKSKFVSGHSQGRDTMAWLNYTDSFCFNNFFTGFDLCLPPY